MQLTELSYQELDQRQSDDGRARRPIAMVKGNRQVADDQRPAVRLGKHAQQLLEHWPDDSASPLRLAKRLGIPINSAYVACKDLCRAGLLQRTPTGFARIKSTQSDRRAIARVQ